MKPIETKKIFVGGLAPSVTEADFRLYFDKYGVIRDAVVMFDRQTQRSRGFGFITFENEVRAQRALLFVRGATDGVPNSHAELGSRGHVRDA